MNNNDLKEKIMNDMTFRRKCGEFKGLSWERFQLCQTYGNEPITIILDTPDKDVFVFMDEEYNVIGVHRFKTGDNVRSFYNAVYDCRSIYDCVSLFYNFRICDIVRLSNRVIISSINHGHSLRMVVNGQQVDTDYGEEYIGLLSYIKFLGEKIENYYKNLYKMTMLGLECPTITAYISAIRKNIDKSIDDNIKEKNRPWPMDLLSYIGDTKEEVSEEYFIELYQIIDLLLYEKGYEVSTEDIYKIKPNGENKHNLFEKSEDLFRLFGVTNEEVKERLDKVRETFTFEEVNLEEFLSGYHKKIKI